MNYQDALRDAQDQADAERKKEEDEFRSWMRAIEQDKEYQKKIRELTNAS